MSDEDTVLIVKLIDSNLGAGTAEKYPALVEQVREAAKSGFPATRLRDVIMNFKRPSGVSYAEALRNWKPEPPADYRPLNGKTITLK